MTSRTHDLGAFAALITATMFYPPGPLKIATIIVALVANIIGAMLPDADQASNRLWQFLPGGSFTGKYLKNVFMAHRTISHSILGMVIIYKLVWWLLPKIFNTDFVEVDIVVNAMLIGYLSHLFLDFMTEEGVPLLFPLNWKFGFPPFKWMRIKTGGWGEKLVVFPLIVIYIVLIGARSIFKV